VDTVLSKKDTLTIEGDIYTGDEGSVIVHSTFTPPDNLEVERLATLSGGDVLGRWNHTISSRWDTTLQFYFDKTRRDSPEANEAANTIDIDFQSHVAVGKRQDIIWGAVYRHTVDDTEGTVDQAFIPTDSAVHYFNLFLQDQVTLKPNRVILYVGAKLENGYFTGFDLQPSVHLAWTPDARRTFWAGISRASRTPSRRDVGLDATLAALPGPAEVVLLGNPNFKSEHVISYELGYRAQPSKRFSIDATVFMNSYHSLASTEPLPSYSDPNSVPPLLVHPSC